jgi:hypothetical protein
MLNKIFSKLCCGKNFRTQSFTYYVPGPPTRKAGYREKQFDKVFYQFINQGFEILDFKTQQHHSKEQSGMWVILIVRALNKTSDELSLDAFFNDQFDTDVTDADDNLQIERD